MLMVSSRDADDDLEHTAFNSSVLLCELPHYLKMGMFAWPQPLLMMYLMQVMIRLS